MKPIRVLAALVAVAALVLAGAALSPSSAAAGGGPILAVAAPDGEGVESPDGLHRYATVSANGTAVVSVTEGSGEIDSTGYVGNTPFGIPQVAADGSTAGLSADGGTLVLIRAFGPVNRASLVILGTNRLDVKKRIGLEGQFGFDAISPDGKTAYVVEYPQPLRYDRYRVLKLNLRTGHLAKDPITDEDVGLEESEEDEGVAGEMRGIALSRVSSDDGRWAYTLYGGGDVPFIHALDTVGDRAVCIFMPELEDLDRKQVAKATIATGPEPGTLSILGRSGGESSELARVDTATFAVTEPEDEVSESGSGLPAALPAALVVAALIAGTVAIVRRRSRSDSGGG